MMPALDVSPVASTAFAIRLTASVPHATHHSSESDRLTLPASLSTSSWLRGGKAPDAS